MSLSKFFLCRSLPTLSGCGVLSRKRVLWQRWGIARIHRAFARPLVFELWNSADTKQLKVRTYYTAQSLEQMRIAVPLSISAPPLRAPVFVPGCSTASEGFDCSWADFQRTMSAAIDPAFVKQ